MRPCNLRSLRLLLPLLSCMLFALTLSGARAQISPAPSILHFQGRLARPDGTPLPDGNYTLRFSLWSAATGGTERWNQTVNPVVVRNGTFAVLLNVAAPADLFHADLWLEIRIGTDPPLTPRQRLVSVAYALKANRVADNAITSASILDGTITGADIANAAITVDKLATGARAWWLTGNAGTNPNTHFVGTTDNQVLAFRTNGTERFRLDTEGRAFLGRTNPIGAGKLIVSENTTGYTGIYVDSGANGLPFYGYSQNGNAPAWTYLDGADGNKWKLFYGSDRLTVTPGGQVGIGINNPVQRLEVGGNLRVHGNDIQLTGRGGGAGNNGGAGRALIDGGSSGGLILNFLNDFGQVAVDSPLRVRGELSLTLSGTGLRFPDGTVQTTAATGGGTGWLLTGNAGTNPNTHFVGTTDNQPLILRANNQRLLGLQFVQTTSGGETHTSGNVVGGFWLNSVATGVTAATIAGGGVRFTLNNNSVDHPNRVFDIGGTVGGGSNNRSGSDDANLLNGQYATVAGGSNNLAGNRFATTGGGLNNTASGAFSTTGGGWLNTASALYATVSGGIGNIASGDGATIPGGSQNRASGPYSLAAGYYADAQHFGAFVWGDFSNSGYITSTADNQFSVRASGGVRFFSNAALTTGVTLASGSGSWSAVSDRRVKENFQPVDLDDLLQRILRVPVMTWNYRSQPASIRHIGPMAQDFYAAFGVGEEETRISGVDADGVALAGIQALYRQIENDRARLKQLEAENAELRVQMQALLDRIERLEQKHR